MGRSVLLVKPRGGAGIDLLRPPAGQIVSLIVSEALSLADARASVRLAVRTQIDAWVASDTAVKVQQLRRLLADVILTSDSQVNSGTGGGTSPLQVVTYKLTDAGTNTPYFGALRTMGATPGSTLTYTDTSGLGIAVAPSGLLVGVITTPGSYTLTGSVSDGTHSTTYSIPINVVGSGGTFALDTSKLPVVGTQNGMYVGRIGSTSGGPIYAIAISSQSGAYTGYIITGEPYGDGANYCWLEGVPNATGSTTINFTGTDCNGATATASVTIVVDNVVRHQGVDPSVSAQKRADGMVGCRYRWTPQVVGTGTPTGSPWSISSGSLPPGLSINSSTGQISGQCTTAGDYTFTMSYAYTSPSGTASQAYSIHVAPDLSISPALNPGTGLFVYNGILYDALGKPTTLMGSNMCHYDSGTQPSFGKVQANAARVFFGTSVSIATTFASLIAHHNAQVIPCWCNNSNAAGSQNISDLTASLDYLHTNKAATATVDGASMSFQAFMNAYGFIDYYNEWGGSPGSPPSVGLAAHKCTKLNVTSISGTTVTLSDPSGLLNASQITLARATLNGASGASDQYVQFSSGSTSAGVATITTSSAITGWTGGGTMSFGCTGVSRGDGWTCPLSAEMGDNYNQDWESFPSVAVAVQNADPIKNSIPSFHIYGGLASFFAKVTSITKGSTTTVNYTSPSALQGSLGTGNPVYGGNRVALFGVQGASQFNGTVSSQNSQGGTSPSFNVNIALNSSGFSGTPSGGWVMSYGNFQLVAAIIGALQSQGCCAFIGEFGCPSPPMSGDLDAHNSTFGQFIRTCMNSGVGWLLWAHDDGGASVALTNFALTGVVSGKGNYNAGPPDLTYAGWDTILHPLNSWYSNAQPAHYLLPAVSTVNTKSVTDSIAPSDTNTKVRRAVRQIIDPFTPTDAETATSTGSMSPLRFWTGDGWQSINVNGTGATNNSEMDTVLAADSSNLFTAYAPWYCWTAFEDTTLGTYDFSMIDSDFNSWQSKCATAGRTAAQSMFGILVAPYKNQTNVTASNAATTEPTGHGVPRYILEGGSATYGLAPPGNPYAGFGWSGFSGNSTNSAYCNAALWNQGVMDRYMAFWDALAAHVITATSGPYAGQSFTVDTHPQIAFVGDYGPTDLNMKDFSAGVPTDYTSAKWQAQWLRRIPRMAASFPHTQTLLMPGFGANGPGSSTEPETDEGLLIDSMVQNGVAFSCTDINGYYTTAATNMNFGQWQFIGNSFSGHTYVSGGRQDQRGIGLSIPTIQEYDYYNRLGPYASKSQALITGLANICVNTFKSSARVWTTTTSAGDNAATIAATIVAGVSAATGVSTVLPATRITKVLGLTLGTHTGTTVNMSWTAQTGVGTGMQYQVYRDGTAVGSPTSSASYSDTSVPTGLHSYTVKAVNANGSGPASSPISVTV